MAFYLDKRILVNGKTSHINVDKMLNLDELIATIAATVRSCNTRSTVSVSTSPSTPIVPLLRTNHAVISADEGRAVTKIKATIFNPNASATLDTVLQVSYGTLSQELTIPATEKTNEVTLESHYVLSLDDELFAKVLSSDEVNTSEDLTVNFTIEDV